MSATGRPDVRQPDDFYATPPWATELVLPQLPLTPGARVLDPCCGEGAILGVLPPAVEGIGMELDAGRAATARAKGFPVTTTDALAPAPWPSADVVLTNPPYRHALDFVERALSEVGDGTVAMLLRLNWLGSMRRARFHVEHPADVYVLSKRPSFARGRTDATEYGWFVWGLGRGGRLSILAPQAPLPSLAKPKALRPDRGLRRAGALASADLNVSATAKRAGGRDR